MCTQKFERGKTMKNKTDVNEKISREEYLYHNTELLLKKYREVVWSIEVSAMHAQINFELEMDCTLEKFLEMYYAAGADLMGTDIQEQLRTLERNKKMLKMIEMSLNILRNRHMNGEVYYWILFYTYLSEKPCKTIDDVISHVEQQTEPMSWKTYFRRRKDAIKTLSTILWGFSSKECLPVLSELLNKNFNITENIIG